MIQLQLSLATIIKVGKTARLLLLGVWFVLVTLVCLEKPAKAQSCPVNSSCNAVFESLVIPSRFSTASNHVFKGEQESPDGLFYDEAIGLSFNRTWNPYAGSGRDDPTQPLTSLELESYWNGNAEFNLDLSPANSNSLIRPFGYAAAYNGSGAYFQLGGSPYSAGASSAQLYSGTGSNALLILTDRSSASSSSNMLQMSRYSGSSSVAWKAGGIPRLNFALQRNLDANSFSNFGVLRFGGEWDYGEPLMEFESIGLSAILLRSVPVTTDSAPRFVLLANGDLEWGPGSTASDTDLYRSAASTLSTDGNLVVRGNLAVTGQKMALVETASYGQREVYAVESPGEWFEDFGSAKLTSTQATVRIDPVFGETVATDREYHVFLTPNGRCTLYVAEKKPTFFEVRRLTGSRRCVFDYRIVAKRKGYETVRLAQIPDGQIAKSR